MWFWPANEMTELVSDVFAYPRLNTTGFTWLHLSCGALDASSGWGWRTGRNYARAVAEVGVEGHLGWDPSGCEFREVSYC
jgi:hypothetical protein